MRDNNLTGRRLLAVTEEELQRMVLDIHDGPVQNLFAALGQLSIVGARLEPFAGAPAECAQPLGLAVALLEESLGEIRQIVSTLYAPEFASRSLQERWCWPSWKSVSLIRAITSGLSAITPTSSCGFILLVMR